MSGLEKITEHIINDAKGKAEEIINKAKSEADEIIRANDEKNTALINENKEKILSETTKITQMAASSDRQEERQALLDVKNSVIKEIIKSAEDKILNMSKQDYVECLKTILKNFISCEKGEILFSKTDKKLLDDDFISYCKEVSDGNLVVSEEIAQIERGFIIRYGKIEQNCSISSIIEEKYNELTDLVNDYISAK